MGRLLLLYFLLLPAVGNTLQNSSVVEREVNLVLSPDATSYCLPDSFILLGSETVEIKGCSIDTSQYAIDYNTGLIQLSTPTRGMMTVRYQVFPYRLSTEYCHRRKMIDSTVESVVREPRNRPVRQTLADGLHIGGSKVFTIGIGSKEEFSLDQSLQLRLRGEVSGVAVTGVLSDRNTSLDGSGTKSVEEVDDVYMEVEGDRFKCRIGAYDLENKGNRFCQLERKLEGVMGSVSLAGIDLEATGASTRHKFRTDTFRGEDGKQGPYQLKSSHGTQSVGVVMGSERVYLDGQRLNRGVDADYVIDYESGTVEFTPRRVITSESRITVDFQYSDEYFKRKVYSGRITAGLPSQNLSLTASLFTERDCVDNSTDSPLNTPMAERLARAGGDTGVVWVNGGELVVDGSGDYLKKDDHYEYVGENLGNYRVAFTYVGDSNGDYLYQEEQGHYEWVQQGGGDYLAQIPVFLPQNRSLYDLTLTYEPIEAFHIDCEHAWATKDRNALSAAHGMRSANAHFVQVGLKEKPLGWGGLAFSTRFWKAGRGFELPSKVTTEEKDKWDGQVDLRGCEAEEVEAAYSLPVFRIDVSAGRMRSQDGSRLRKAVKTTLNPDRPSRAFLAYESVARRTGDQMWFKERRNAGVRHQFWHLTPSLLYSEEVSDLQRAKTYGLLIELMSLASISGSYQHQIIVRDRKNPSGRWESESNEVRDVLTCRLNSNHTRADCHYTRRRKDFTTSATGQLDYSLFSLSVSSIPMEKRLEFDLSSSFTSRKSPKREALYVEVDEGDGDYVRDPLSGEYYPCESGDYIRKCAWTGDSEPRLGIDFDFHCRFRPTGAVALSTQILTEREIQNRDALFSIWSGESVRNLFHNALEISNGSRRISLKLDHRWCLTLTPWGQREIEERRSVRLRTAAGRMELTILATEDKGKSGTSLHTRMEDRVRKIEGTEMLRVPPFSFSLLEGLEMAQIRFPRDYASLGWMAVNSVFLGPSVRYEVGAKYSLEGKAKISFSTSEDETPYILTVTNPPGMGYEWGALLNYWLSQSVSSTFSYEGEKKRGDPDHQFTAEIRGYF